MFGSSLKMRHYRKVQICRSNALFKAWTFPLLPLCDSDAALWKKSNEICWNGSSTLVKLSEYYSLAKISQISQPQPLDNQTFWKPSSTLLSLLEALLKTPQESSISQTDTRAPPPSLEEHCTWCVGLAFSNQSVQLTEPQRLGYERASATVFPHAVTASTTASSSTSPDVRKQLPAA